MSLDPFPHPLREGDGGVEHRADLAHRLLEVAVEAERLAGTADGMGDHAAIDRGQHHLGARVAVLSVLHHFGKKLLDEFDGFFAKDIADRIRALVGRVLAQLGLPAPAAGWLSPSTPAEFEKYAAYVAWKYGDQVDNWTVLNEPVPPVLTEFLAVPGLVPSWPPGLIRPDLASTTRPHRRPRH